MVVITLNLNGLMTHTKVSMLHNFLRVHDIDILFKQEITSTEELNIFGYTTHINVGTNMRGTALMVKDGLTLVHVKTLPKGRAITAFF
jgi:exonuclease III